MRYPNCDETYFISFRIILAAGFQRSSCLICDPKQVPSGRISISNSEGISIVVTFPFKTRKHNFILGPIFCVTP